MPSQLTFDLTQTDFLLEPNQSVTISFDDGFMIGDGDTANQQLSIVTFTPSPVLITVSIGSYTPNEKSLNFSFNKPVSYNAGSIYIYGEDSTVAREIDSTTLDTVDTSSTTIEVPIPQPAEALEDNARYWIVLDDDLWISDDRVLSKFNSWTNQRVDHDFLTGSEGLDDFVAFLPPAIHTLVADNSRIRSFDVSMTVTTAQSSTAVKVKDFDPATYQVLSFANPNQHTGYQVLAWDNVFAEYNGVYNNTTTAQEGYIASTYGLPSRDLHDMVKFTDQADRDCFLIHRRNDDVATAYIQDLSYNVYAQDDYNSNLTTGLSFKYAGYKRKIVKVDGGDDSNRGKLYQYNVDTTGGTGLRLETSEDFSIVNPNTNQSSDWNFGQGLDVNSKYIAVSDIDATEIQIYSTVDGSSVRTLSITYSSGLNRIKLGKNAATEDYVYVSQNDVIEAYNVTTGSKDYTYSLGDTFIQMAINEAYVAVTRRTGVGSDNEVVLLDAQDLSFVKTISNPNYETSDTVDQFGTALDLSEEALVIGAYQEDVPYGSGLTATNAGVVYIFNTN